MLNAFLYNLAAAGAPCTPAPGGDFFGFPKWYKYLELTGTEQTDGSCAANVGIHSLSDIWKVAAAIFELLLRLGALIAVFFIIWGAFNLIMAQGEPERIKAGKSTITNAIIGLVITVLAATIVSVVARKLI